MPEVNYHIPKPNEKQKLFWGSKTRFVAYGGARGGGKSWAVRQLAGILALKYPGIRMLLVRRTYAELDTNHIIPLRQQLRDVAIYNDSRKEFAFVSGSRLRLGYCDTDADALRYQGQEYDVIFIDEATQLTETQFVWISACCRGANDFPKRIYLTCNPGGVGHGWVKRLFIDRDYRDGESPNDYTFIPAKATDNSVLMDKDPEYLRMLDALPDDLRRAWRDGDWDVFAGQFFTDWRRDLHVIPAFMPPTSWRKYVTIDYGLDMLAALWVAMSPDGRAVVYRELYRPNLIATDAANAINDLSSGETIYEYLAPPDLWGRRSDTGRSTADIFLDSGIILTKTGNSRVSGWLTVAEWLRPVKGSDGNQYARLQICENCINLIRCIPLLQHDAKNPNDCANEPHEITHAPDALRGFCVWRADAVKPEIAENPDPFKINTKSNQVGRGEKIRVV